MSELLWTCGNGVEFVSTASGYKVSVRRSRLDAGFEFQIMPLNDKEAPVASGYRRDLREAFDASERTLGSLLENRSARQKLMVA